MVISCQVDNNKRLATIEIRYSIGAPWLSRFGNVYSYKSKYILQLLVLNPLLF